MVRTPRQAPTWRKISSGLPERPTIPFLMMMNIPTETTPPIIVIACQVLQDLVERLLPPGLASRVTFLDYGLHRVPVKMTHRLQSLIDEIVEPSLIVLGYGLCGNGLRGLKAGLHTLLVPRADDCIAILLGSYKAYLEQFSAEPGTYYLSKGWLELGSHPLKEFEEYVEKYGPKDAAWIMDQQYQNYNRLVLVTHNREDLEKYRLEALKVAKYCEQWGMRYEEIIGSEVYVQQLIEVAANLSKANEDFVLIPPGGVLLQDMFMR